MSGEFDENEDEVHESPQGSTAFAQSPIEKAIEEEQTEQAKFPTGFGMSFRNMDDAQYVAVMTYLREWVEWLRLEFAFTASELSPCWFQHSDICYELYSMCAAEYKVWSGGEPTTMPAFSLLPQLENMRNRIRGRCDRCNVAREHVPATVPQFNVDEDAWAQQLKRVSPPSPAPTT